MATLQYRAGVTLDDLVPGECTIRRVVGLEAGDWWNLWCCVLREDRPTEPFLFRVFVVPRGPHGAGPGGKLAWGLADLGGGRWQVSPSIDVGDLWHQTPMLVGVPPGEPWL